MVPLKKKTQTLITHLRVKTLSKGHYDGCFEHCDEDIFGTRRAMNAVDGAFES